MPKHPLLIGLALFIPLLAGPAFAADGPYPVQILRVIDGDTLEVEARVWPGVRIRETLRLTGVNAPELRGKPCEKEAAKRAADFVRSWVQKPEIALTLLGKDKYGRSLGRLHAGDSDLGAELIKSGHAKAYTGGRRAAWC